MTHDPSAEQHASRPGLMTYLVLGGIALGGLVVIYGASLKAFFGIA